MLTWMQDNEADGLIFIGPPGAAKSAVAKATGNTAGIPTIAFDLGAMQSSAGRRLRGATPVGAQGSRCGEPRACAVYRNMQLHRFAAAGITPAFTSGTFFFDLPSADEREAIWRFTRRSTASPANSPKTRDGRERKSKSVAGRRDRLRLPLRARGSVHRTDLEVGSRTDEVVAAAGVGKVHQCIERGSVPVRGNCNCADRHDAAHPECGGLGI